MLHLQKWIGPQCQTSCFHTLIDDQSCQWTEIDPHFPNAVSRKLRNELMESKPKTWLFSRVKYMAGHITSFKRVA